MLLAPRRPAADGAEIRVRAELILEESAERGCEELGQMTYPGQEFIVPSSIHVERAAPEAFHEPAKLGCHRCCLWCRRDGIGAREQPDRTAK